MAANLRYQPEFADWLVLRASFNEGFKAPNLTDLYSKQSQSFQWRNVISHSASRKACQQLTVPSYQVENYTGGNPLLEAEEADAYNVGFVMSPPQVEGLSFSFDYFEIDSEDERLNSLGQLVALAAEGNLPAGTAVIRELLRRMVVSVVL